MSHVFISYAHTDTEYARKLANHLIANGFDVWIDDRIDFGSRWVRSIFEAVEACDAFIVIMTPKAYESEFVEKEYLHAGNLDKPSFPLLLEGRAFPYFVGIQYYDVQGGVLPAQDFFEDLARFAPRGSEGHDVASTPIKAVKKASSPDATGEYLTAPKESAVLPDSVSTVSVIEPDAAPQNAIYEATKPDTKANTKSSRSSLLLAAGAVFIALVVLALILRPRSELDPASAATITADGNRSTTSPPTAMADLLPTGVGGGHGEIAFVSTQDGNNEIYLMNSDGSNVRRLTNDPDSDTELTWSPDGSRIIFTSYNADANIENYVMAADGSNRQSITEWFGSDMAWSPDGTKILFGAYGDLSGDIFVVDADGTNPRPLTSNDYDEAYPAWSPDGSQIVYAVRQEGHEDLYIMDADGGNLRPLTDDAPSDLYPAWSPDGTQIAFQSDRDGDNIIYLIGVDGSNLRPLSSEPGDGYEPSWSPDGTQIAFASYRESNASEIYVANADGSNLRRLTNNSVDDKSPVWRP
jgi:Tol biopolymer transport system component